ncbi:hypothetical protein G7K_0204-t1 [Saitoella complicata NRRL Y-17804]|uniref:Uncharacterized protein n=1 Tax=Saitoella complicata (strain BCRC 22490 / CBS 7301 / JCM 7358 / NBRC 10748 / NRRL Y-17804) TaxID=698492 RepID=A0A0E9N810_SAICN|nr:hypothetical protein G7K_0204-t1 [Saitoella complicata NRRL Y-17804]
MRQYGPEPLCVLLGLLPPPSSLLAPLSSQSSSGFSLVLHTQPSSRNTEGISHSSAPTQPRTPTTSAVLPGPPPPPPRPRNEPNIRVHSALCCARAWRWEPHGARRRGVIEAPSFLYKYQGRLPPSSTALANTPGPQALLPLPHTQQQQPTNQPQNKMPITTHTYPHTPATPATPKAHKNWHWPGDKNPKFYTTKVSLKKGYIGQAEYDAIMAMRNGPTAHIV